MLTGLRERAGLGSTTNAGLLSLAVLAVAGLVGLVLRQPCLFPSRGPTLMVIAETPVSLRHGPATSWSAT
jgi:hypothetical protein